MDIQYMPSITPEQMKRNLDKAVKDLKDALEDISEIETEIENGKEKHIPGYTRKLDDIVTRSGNPEPNSLMGLITKISQNRLHNTQSYIKELTGGLLIFNEKGNVQLLWNKERIPTTLKVLIQELNNHLDNCNIKIIITD
jgi:hypothetical protein